MYDGLEDGWPISTFESKFLARQAIDTDVTISFTASQQRGPTFDVVTTVCVEPGGVGKNMRIHVVQSLDTYPASRSYNRHTVMQGLSGIDVFVAEGSCEIVNHSITFDPVSWGLFDQMQLTVWAQEPLPSDPAEVYQAKQLRWPFIEGYLFSDGFEDGTTNAWAVTSP